MKTLSLTNLDRITKLDFNKTSSVGSVGGSLSITKFKNLEVLKAAYNDLSTIAFSTANSGTVKELDLSNNLLTSVSNLGSLTSLETLDLSNNSLPLSEVDSILTALDTSGLSNSTVQLGGTNTLPTLGNYNTEKLSLESKGWTVGIAGGIDTSFNSSEGYLAYDGQALSTHPDWEGRPESADFPNQWKIDATNNTITCNNDRSVGISMRNIRNVHPIKVKVGSKVRILADVDFGAGQSLSTVDNVSAAVSGRTAGTYTISATDYSIAPSVGIGAKFSIVVDSSGAATITVTAGGSGYSVNDTITIADAKLGGGGAAALTFDVATVQNGFSLAGTRTFMLSLSDMATYELDNEYVLTHPNESFMITFRPNGPGGTNSARLFRRMPQIDGVNQNSQVIGNLNLSTIANDTIRLQLDFDIGASAAETTITVLYKNLTNNPPITAVNNAVITGVNAPIYAALINSNNDIKINIQAGELEDSGIGTITVHKAQAFSIN